jgi:HEAT repeat protein
MFSRYFAPNVERLARQGDVAGLLRAYAHPRADIRKHAAEVLIHSQDPAVVPALLAGLSDGQSGCARLLAARRDLESIPALCSALGSASPTLAQEARAALVMLGAADALRQTAGNILLPANARVLALRALNALDPADLADVLAAALGDPAPEVRDAAIQLGARPTAPAPAEPAHRRAAARARAWNGVPGDVEALLADLQDPAAEVRAAAAFGLARLGTRDAVPQLEAAAADGAALVRAAAARALGELRTGLPCLVGLLDDADSLVRQEAALGLGKLGDAAAVEPLVGALDRGEWAAARALGELGDRRAVSPLIAALDRAELAPVAAESLGYLGDASALPALERALRSWTPSTHQAPDDVTLRDTAQTAIRSLRASARTPPRA